ncbi:MAG TPA: hypothetical protein VFA75_07985 [Nevskia sp.]|nr:hypothetical protein [Nevskia sp.]
MPFINEKIGEADKARIDWTKFKTIPNDSDPGMRDPDWWTIDRERDVFFICIHPGGPDGGGVPTYALSWKGALIRIYAKGIWEIENLGDWEIAGLQIPPDLLQSQSSEILQVLKEALIVHGFNYDGPYTKAVKIVVPGHQE